MTRVKCVVWDLDGTVWAETAVEGGVEVLPQPRPEVLAAIDELTALGVPSAVASRSAPEIGALVSADPVLAQRFVHVEVSWQDKSQALRRIAESLGIDVTSLVLVDDSGYERAEVTALAGAWAIEPEGVPHLLAELRAHPVTADGAARVQRYREAVTRRDAENTFEGDRAAFQAWCELQVTVGAARGAADHARFHELAERTHRLNSSGLTAPQIDVLLTAGARLWLVEARDRFGEYGIVGGCLVETSEPVWQVRLLALSCRVAGRGISTAFLAWLLQQARAAGAAEFRIDYRPTAANLELRLVLRQAGLRTTETPGVLGRSLTGELPAIPDGLRLSEWESGQ